MRLIALSDRVLGRDANYDAFDSALEAIREHRSLLSRRRGHVLGVPRPTAAPRGHRPARQTEPEPPPPTFERTASCSRTPRHTCSSKACPTASSGARPTTSTRARSPIRRSSGTTRCPSAGIGRSSPRSRVDAELPSRSGVAFVTEIVNRITPRFRDLRSGSRWFVALLVRSTGRVADDRGLWTAAFLVLLVHAASQGVAPEFALPLYPVFIVTALAALAGRARTSVGR